MMQIFLNIADSLSDDNTDYIVAPETFINNNVWLHELKIEYDSSTFDTDPFEPQPEPVTTIFPFVVMKHPEVLSSYVEIPYTLPQDFTLYVLMKEKTNEIGQKLVKRKY